MLFLEKENLVNGLILGADGDIVLRRDDQEPFEFMLTGQMQRQPFEEVAISPEPGTVSALGCEGKRFPSYNFLKWPRGFSGLHLAVLTHEQFVVGHRESSVSDER